MISRLDDVWLSAELMAATNVSAAQNEGMTTLTIGVVNAAMVRKSY